MNSVCQLWVSSVWTTRFASDRFWSQNQLLRRWSTARTAMCWMYGKKYHAKVMTYKLIECSEGWFLSRWSLAELCRVHAQLQTSVQRGSDSNTHQFDGNADMHTNLHIQHCYCLQECWMGLTVAVEDVTRSMCLKTFIWLVGSAKRIKSCSNCPKRPRMRWETDTMWL